MSITVIATGFKKDIPSMINPGNIIMIDSDFRYDRTQASTALELGLDEHLAEHGEVVADALLLHDGDLAALGREEHGDLAADAAAADDTNTSAGKF